MSYISHMNSIGDLVQLKKTKNVGVVISVVPANSYVSKNTSNSPLDVFYVFFGRTIQGPLFSNELTFIHSKYCTFV